MLHSRHFAANYLTGKGLEDIQSTCHCMLSESKHTILGFCFKVANLLKA